MSASALLGTLGQVGAGYGQVRDRNQQAQAEAQQRSQEMAMRLQAFLQQQRVQTALEQYRQQELQQRQELEKRPDWRPSQPYQDDKGQWHLPSLDAHSGKTQETPIGTPASVVRSEETSDASAQRQKDRIKATADLAAQKNKWTRDQIRLRAATHATSAGGPGAIPLATARWYKVLGGDVITQKINSLIHATAMGDLDPDLKQHEAELSQLYVKHQELLDEATKRAEAAAPKAAPPAKPGGSIVVNPEDMK